MKTAADTVVHHLDRQDQDLWVHEVREVLRQAPLVRPKTPNGLPMRVRVSAAGKYGWVGDGEYRYDEHQRDGRPWPEMPRRWSDLANQVVGASKPWDSAIINWYDEDASLGWHQDRAELFGHLPIVTVSLGDACSWAIREDQHDPPSRTRLESGDVTLLVGETRYYFHTVERIIPAPLLSPLKVRGRISVTLRVAR